MIYVAGVSALLSSLWLFGFRLCRVWGIVEPRELGFGVHARGGDGLRGSLRHLRDAFLVAVVRHQVVPVRILILDAADVHTHRVQFAQGTE